MVMLADPIERAGLAAPMAERVVLHPPAGLIEYEVGELPTCRSIVGTSSRPSTVRTFTYSGHAPSCGTTIVGSVGWWTSAIATEPSKSRWITP